MSTPLTDPEKAEAVVLHLMGLDTIKIAAEMDRHHNTIRAHLTALGYWLPRGAAPKDHCKRGHDLDTYGKPLVRRGPKGGLARNGRDCFACIAERKGAPIPTPEEATALRAHVAEGIKKRMENESR